MKNQIAVVVAVLAVGAIFFTGTDIFKNGSSTIDQNLSFSFPSFSFPSLSIYPDNDYQTAQLAWTTFQNYLEFARVHDMEGLKNLSHQISPACADFSREEECFALMDSVYAIAGQFKKDEFKNVQADERQIILFTDYQEFFEDDENGDYPRFRTVIYFTKDEDGNPKVLGIRFCTEKENVSDECVESDPSLRDKNNNGWWDNVESIFY